MNNNILYLILISIFVIAIILKYMCVYVFKCDPKLKTKNIYIV